MDEVACPECGEEYKMLGQHWRYSPDHRPSFTAHQREILIGLLMGDGAVVRDNKNPRIQIKMTSPNYLEYLDGKFGCLTTGVSLNQTAAEVAKMNRESGFYPKAKTKNHSDVYILRSRMHPELQEFGEWYSGGKKVWPADIELTPTVLKHWYCGDGTWDNSGAVNHIQIAMANEVDNTDKVDEMFTKVGLPSPSNYCISGNGCNAQFTVEQSKQLWEYMGSPLPDFEDKWPKKYRQR